MKITNQCRVSLSSPHKCTLTHPNNKKDKVEESRGKIKNNATVTETFSFAKSVYIYKYFKMGSEANCTSIEKKRSQYLQSVPGESWSNHLYIKLHFLQITIDIQK